MSKMHGLVIAGVAVAALGGFAVSGATKPGVARAAEDAEPAKVLRHVVLFRFKESATAEDVARIEQAFAALPAQIDAIHDFEFGTNNSPEGLNDGFTHCFLVTFRDEAGRDAYLPHPAHKAFVDVLRPHLDKALVVDYWAGQ